MPARSKSQQRLFGWVHAVQKGEAKNAPASIRRIAKSISKSDAKHFAETKHKGLPERKEKKHKDEGERKVAYVLPRLVKQAGIGYTLDSSKENKMTSQKFVKVASYVLEKRAHLRKQACKDAVARVFIEEHARMEKQAQVAAILRALKTFGGKALTAAKGFGRSVMGKPVAEAAAAQAKNTARQARLSEFVQKSIDAENELRKAVIRNRAELHKWRNNWARSGKARKLAPVLDNQINENASRRFRAYLAQDAAKAERVGLDKAYDAARKNMIRDRWIAGAGAAGVAAPAVGLATSTYSPKAGGQFDNSPYAPSEFKFGK